MAKIALIPIDNRPVCYDLPKNIVNLSKENKIYLPSKSLLGGLDTASDINSILLWLENLENVDYIVISLDTIAYGGLVASRRSTDNFEQIKNRIDSLAGILRKKQAKVFAFSSIMRISNNNFNEEEKEYWNLYGQKIFQYSYNLHKTGVEDISDIPQEILTDYLNTRMRNFKINKYYIELARKGLFSTLVFSKDDCAQFGLNVKEAQELNTLKDNNNNIFIKTGADEIPLTLISRALNEYKNIKIAPVFINPDSKDKISKYEDISVLKSVQGQIELAGARISDEKNCDLIMLINNFKTEQGELVMNIDTELFKGDLKLPDKPYFIADIVNANGSDNNFVNALLEKENFKEFYGYTAWNTTGNTFGSAISTALTYFGSKHPDEKAFKHLQLIRFLDDWAYQANVRSIIRNKAENLKNDFVQKEMKKYEKILFTKFEVKHQKAVYSFPWERFFEIEIKLAHIYTHLPFIDILFCE